MIDTKEKITEERCEHVNFVLNRVILALSEALKMSGGKRDEA